MPWYKIEFRSGPGHQSKHVEYEFVEHVLTDAEEQDLFESHSWTDDDAKGMVCVIEALPPKIRDGFIADYKQELKHAAEMLQVLWATPSTEISVDSSTVK